jgi:hypothetical protein
MADEAGVDQKNRLWPKDARWLWRRIKEVRPNLQAAGLHANHREISGMTTIEITRITPENDADDPSEGIDLFDRADRQENIRNGEDDVPLGDRQGNPAEDLT